MSTLLIIAGILVGIFVLYKISTILFTKNKIVIGTISAETISAKEKLIKKGYQILHADQLRDRGVLYEKAGKKIFLIFLVKHLLFQKTVLFSSNPKFLEKKWRAIVTLFFELEVVDERSTREKNIAWVESLSGRQGYDEIPHYFIYSEEGLGCSIEERGAKKKEIMTQELKRYSDDRFRKPFIDA